MRAKPALLCWITCDGVHVDPATGKHTLLGVFANIRAHKFPATHPFMVWFLTVTDCPTGEHKLRISMGLDPANTTLLRECTFQSQSPLQRINLINEIANLTFPQPGVYAIVVEVDEETLLVTNISVTN